MNPKLIRSIGDQFNLQSHQLTPIEGGYQNTLFKVDFGRENRILRLSSAHIRSKREILSEIRWCQSLAQAGLFVVNVKECPDQKFVHTIKTDNEVFYAVWFEEVKGRKLTYPEYLNDEDVFEKLGELTGKIHRHSVQYTQENQIYRPYWYDNAYLKQFKALADPHHTELAKAFDSVFEELRSFAMDKSNFGLIHGDINVGNFHVYHNDIILFDFDECQFSWFAEEIAISLFYTVYVYGEDIKDQRIRQGRTFLRKFLDGYSKHFSLSDSDLAMIDTFLKLREIIVYVGILKKWDFDHLNQWQQDYLKDTQKRICQQEPLLKLRDLLG